MRNLENDPQQKILVPLTDEFISSRLESMINFEEVNTNKYVLSGVLIFDLAVTLLCTLPKQTLCSWSIWRIACICSFKATQGKIT